VSLRSCEDEFIQYRLGVARRIKTPPVVVLTLQNPSDQADREARPGGLLRVHRRPAGLPRPATGSDASRRRAAELRPTAHPVRTEGFAAATSDSRQVLRVRVKTSRPHGCPSRFLQDSAAHQFPLSRRRGDSVGETHREGLPGQRSDGKDLDNHVSARCMCSDIERTSQFSRREQSVLVQEVLEVSEDFF